MLNKQMCGLVNIKQKNLIFILIHLIWNSVLEDSKVEWFIYKCLVSIFNRPFLALDDVEWLWVSPFVVSFVFLLHICSLFANGKFKKVFGIYIWFSRSVYILVL